MDFKRLILKAITEKGPDVYDSAKDVISYNKKKKQDKKHAEDVKKRAEESKKRVIDKLISCIHEEGRIQGKEVNHNALEKFVPLLYQAMRNQELFKPQPMTEKEAEEYVFTLYELRKEEMYINKRK